MTTMVAHMGYIKGGLHPVASLGTNCWGGGPLGECLPMEGKNHHMSFWLIPEQDPVHRVGFSLQP